MPQQWSKEIVVRHILKRHRGEQKLNSGYIQVHHRALYLAGCVYFGSWRKSIESSGLKYDDVRVKQRNCPVWSEGKIITTIKRRYRLRQPLNSNYIQTKEHRLYGAAVKYFGGWAQAIASAGLDYSKLRKQTMRSWSKAVIVNEVVCRVQAGLSIRGADVYFEDEGLYQAARRYFGNGGWAKARVLAGYDPVDPRPWKIWDEQSVREEILQLYESGIALNTGAMQGSAYAYLLAGGCKVFGSWARAIRASGLNYSNIRKNRQHGWWTKSRIIMCIRALDSRRVRLSHNSIRDRHNPLLAAAIQHFGSWSQAVEAAGIPYRLHTRVWSTKAWLRRMHEDEYNTTLERAKLNAIKRRRSR